MLHELFNALEETLFMVFASGLLTLIVGLPLGILLAITERKQLLENTLVHRCLEVLLQATRSTPYIILMIALIPVTHWLMGSREGCIAAIFPLTLATIPFFAKSCEQAIRDLPKGLSEAAEAMGASLFQIIRYVFMPEAQSKITRGFADTLIHLLGYSTIAGALGSGGLGGLAIDKGYQAFQVQYILATAFILIIMVQLIQWVGEYFAQSSLK